MDGDSKLSQVRPLADRVVIKKIEEEERKWGSIIIPPSANEIDMSWTAEVIAVGRGRELENGTLVPPSVKPGDKVIVGKYMGPEIKIDEQKYYVVRDDDLLAVIEDG